MRNSLPIVIFAGAILVFTAAWISAPPAPVDPAWGGELPSAATPRAELPTMGSDVSPRQLPAVDPSQTVYGFDRPWEVALTFDDGPHPYQTRRLLRILARYEVPATFFINGMWLDKGRGNMASARAVVRETVAAGHAIGNHTYSHQLLTRLTPDEQTWQIVANEVLVSTITGQRMRLFRPPYGKMTAHATKVLKQYGYIETLWNATAADQEIRDPQRIAGTVMMWLKKHRGGIVLLHDRHRWSVDAMALFLARLRRENCRRLSTGKPFFNVLPLEHFLRSKAERQTLGTPKRYRRANAKARLERQCRPTLASR